MGRPDQDRPSLLAENLRLRVRLEELETTLDAILKGGVDGVVVPGASNTLYRLEGADAPYRVLVETMNEGALTLSTDGVIVYCNTHFADMVETPHEQLVGRNLVDFGRAQDRAGIRGVLERCSHGSTKEELTLVTASGREFPVLFSYGAIEHGDSLGLNVVLTDLTERRQSEESKIALERQLLHSQKLESLGVLAGGIAHDFNNILMAIAGHVELALLKLPEESPARHHLKQIKSAGAKGANLTKQMLAYSGRGQVLVETVDLNFVAAELKPMLRVSVPKTIQLAFTPAPEPAWIRGDLGQVHQVLMNLVLNGAEAIGDRAGRVAIEVHHGEWEEITVSDTGCGMSPETLAKIYEPFFTTKFTGRGLGLAAVHGIVASHQGQIFIQSEPGVGTVFRVCFPPAPVPGQPPREAVQNTWKGSGTVLLVEDEDDVRRVSSALLRALGFTVVAVSDGFEAERELADRPDLRAVVLDLVLPGIPGQEVLTFIRDRRPNLPVLLASGHCEETILAHAGSGPTAALTKPFDLDRLRASLQSLLARGPAPRK